MNGEQVVRAVQQLMSMLDDPTVNTEGFVLNRLVVVQEKTSGPASFMVFGEDEDGRKFKYAVYANEFGEVADGA